MGWNKRSEVKFFTLFTGSSGSFLPNEETTVYTGYTNAKKIGVLKMFCKI